MTRRNFAKLEFLIPRGRLADLAAITIFSIAAILITFPLILHLGDRIPGWPGDNAYFYWEYWWFKHALLDLHMSPFVDHELYYPVGLELARDEMMPANTLLGLPFTISFGPAVAYNVMLLLTFPLSGYAVFRIIEEVTGSRLAALVGGLAFAIAPFRIIRLSGHPNLLTTQWLAFCLLFVERFFHSRRWLDGALAGFFFGLNALAAWYYLYIGAVALGIYALVRARPLRKTLQDRNSWMGAGLFAILASLLIVPFAIPYLQLTQTSTLTRTFSDLDFWSANPTDLLQPNPLHPIWGHAVREIFPFQWSQEVERTLSLGWVLVLLAGIGIWKFGARSVVQALAIMTLMSFVFTLGPTLHWAGVRVEYSLPSRLVQLVERVGLTAVVRDWVDPSLAQAMEAGRGFVPLPAMLLYAIVPLTSSLRAILRFGSATFLGVALLASFGLVAIKQHSKQMTLPLIVGSLAIFELWSGLPDKYPLWTEIRPRPVDEWLAAQGSQNVIVEYPVIENVSAAATMHHTFNHQLMVLGGFPSSFKPPVLFERAERIQSFPSVSALAALREFKTRYVLVTPGLFANANEWQNFQLGLIALPDLQMIGNIGGVLVFEISGDY